MFAAVHFCLAFVKPSGLPRHAAPAIVGLVRHSCGLDTASVDFEVCRFHRGTSRGRPTFRWQMLFVAPETGLVGAVCV